MKKWNEAKQIGSHSFQCSHVCSDDDDWLSVESWSFLSISVTRRAANYVPTMIMQTHSESAAKDPSKIKNCKTIPRGTRRIERRVVVANNFNEAILADQGTSCKVSEIMERLEWTAVQWEKDRGDGYVRQLMEKSEEQVGCEEGGVMGVTITASLASSSR